MSADNMACTDGIGKGSSLPELEVIPAENRAGRAESTRRRFEVLKSFAFTCQYCGQKAPDVELVVEHVVPIAKGGGDTPDNWTCACQQCNSGKAISCIPDGAVRTLDKMLAGNGTSWEQRDVLARRLATEWGFTLCRMAKPAELPEYRVAFLRSAVGHVGVWSLRSLMQVAVWSVEPTPNSQTPGDLNDAETWAFFAMQAVNLSESNFMVD